MKIFIIAIITLLIFAGLSSYSFSDICCMFSSSRYYGWPYPYLVLNKSVETLPEAERIKTDSAPDLVSAGWEWNFNTHMTRGLLGSPALSLAADLGLSFLLALFLFGIHKFIKNGKK